MKGMRVDFSNGSKDDVGSGLYNDKGGLVGMLEARAYRSVDTIFPFIGIFLDWCGDEAQEARQTHLFALYVDIMEQTLSYNGYDTSWTVTALEKLDIALPYKYLYLPLDHL